MYDAENDIVGRSDRMHFLQSEAPFSSRFLWAVCGLHAGKAPCAPRLFEGLLITLRPAPFAFFFLPSNQMK